MRTVAPGIAETVTVARRARGTTSASGPVLPK